MTRYLMILAFVSSACLPTAEREAVCENEPPPAVDPSEGPADEELSALATWTSRSVSLLPDTEGPSYEGDRLLVLVPSETSLSELDIVTTLSRAQDHNSSRSNKTASVFVGGDDFGDDDVTLRWDAAARCTELPCFSSERPSGASSRLLVGLGSALDDGRFSMSWGETSSIDESFDGYVSVGTRHRGHVTVLKAAATDDGEIALTSELASIYLAIYDGETLVFEGKPRPGMPLALVGGTSGASWPRGVSIEETPLGTLIGFSW